jgi:hypothetical protein
MKAAVNTPMTTAAVVATVAIVAPAYNITLAGGSGTRLGEGGASRTVPGIGWADEDDPDAVAAPTGRVGLGMPVGAGLPALVVGSGPSDDAGCLDG